MIARRMRMNTPSKSSVTRLISYLTNTQGSSSRVGEVRVTGCGPVSAFFFIMSWRLIY